MMSKKLRGNLMLLTTALIWGSAFVAQSTGMNYVGPLTYNALRMILGGIVLLPVIVLFDRLTPAANRPSPEERRTISRNSLTGGLICGVILSIASSLQQIGISMTSVGSAGFITGLYIVIVPLLGVFFRRKIPGSIWICVVCAVIGFYLLSVKDGLSVSRGDLLVLVSTLFFSFHIMVIDHFASGSIDGVRMSCVQFWVCGLLTLVPALLTETITWEGVWGARMTILYTGVLSSGVAYTLQILGQKDTPPATATLILSLESVFAALSGWLFLHEQMSVREICGCALVFFAVLLAQFPMPKRKKSKNNA